MLLFLPPWLRAEEPAPQEDTSPQPIQTQQAAPEDGTGSDAAHTLRLWNGSAVETMTAAEYLPGVVRGEMPAAFSQQALDAQAVAERTFICYHMVGGRKDAHPEADVCTSSACCSAYVSQEDAAARWGDKAEERANLWLGYIAAVLLHGFYDSCAMINTVASSLIFIAFVIIMYIVVIKKVNKESQNDGPIT